MRLRTRFEEIKHGHNLETQQDTLLQKRDQQKLVDNSESQRPKRIKKTKNRLDGNL